ncbi:MAG TPA: caspase family protein [Gaiellaceae bacterium]|nr:caspase family protein [Gaiellaceae bacterium]
MDWAIVIGVDEYGSREPQLRSAVTDAEAFRRWLLREFGVGEEEPRTDEERARVAEIESRIFTLLGRRPDDERRIAGERLPTKDNVLSTVSELMAKSGGAGERLFGFFSGHGITAAFAGREESALVFPGVDDSQPVQTLAVRSIMEFFESTQFRDQFFFLDACRSPLEKRSGEIGPWMIPRRREPGQSPAQQFVLYATSPGRPAASSLWDEQLSAFTGVLMPGLEGEGQAKAWSWERNCYEVRWERLATYVHDVMEGRREKDELGEPRYPFQIPQDAGVRGVAGRDRDALLAQPRVATVERHELTLELDTDSRQDVRIVVTDAIGTEVATAVNVTGGSHSFELQPRTYSARAFAEGRVGRLRVPVDLYGDRTRRIDWLEPGEDVDVDPFEDGTIVLQARDPLAVADIRDDTGWGVGIATGKRGCEAPPGFYHLRLVGPERDRTGEGTVVELAGGAELPVEPPEPPVNEPAAAVAGALGGSVEGGHVVPVAGAQPAAWAEPSTVVAAAVGAAIHGDAAAVAGLGLAGPLALVEGGSGVALFVVAGDDTTSLADLSVRVWPAGLAVPEEAKPLSPSPAGVASLVEEAEQPRPYWLSIEAEGAAPTVLSLPLLMDRLAVVVAQAEAGRLRVYQFHPLARPSEWSTADWLRGVENLQRRLLGGRLEGADELATEIALEAKNDPFASCLAGYVLLRLGLREGLGKLTSDIVEVAPSLADAYVLRGEYEAYKQDPDATNQAFAEGVSAGMPAFGEGLTRLVEGLRVSGFFHPRGALVRYVFQRHARGNMWAAFTPRYEYRPGRLVITGADIGYEG